MGRLLTDKPCEVTFLDRISNTKVTLFHRLPTTEERVKYSGSMIRRDGNKIKNMTGETRAKFGLKILLGVSEGSFETEKGPLSTDPQSKNYDAAWKTFIAQYASDIVEMLAIHVFEASVSSAILEPEKETSDDDEDEIPPTGEEKPGTAEGDSATVFLEDLAIIGQGKICSDKEERKCSEETGDYLEWACGHCEKKRYKDLTPYTRAIMDIRHLRVAGYPFGANSLSLEQWEDLGTLEETLKAIERKQPRPFYLVKLKG